MSLVEKSKAAVVEPPMISVGDIYEKLLHNKWKLAIITGAFFIASIIVALLLTDKYRSEALLATSQEDGGGSISNLASRYGGIASLAGINLETQGADRTTINLETLRSRKFLFRFIEENNVLVALMAAKGWNKVSGKIEVDPDIYDLNKNEWVRKVSPPLTQIPSPQEAYREFLKIMKVDHDASTGLVTLSIEFYSPVLAKEWVDLLISDLNKTVMEREVTQAEQAIQYLNEQVEYTSLKELHSVFFRLIEEQTRTIMLARVTSEYFLKTIDPAVVPDKRSWPNRVLIVLVGFVTGISLAITFILISPSLGTSSRQSEMAT